MFSPEEIERYARHIVLRDMGSPGQQKLKVARVLVIGAGGLGSPAILYLAAAGVGTIGVVDFDVVSMSNLQRQVLFKTADKDRSKVEVAAERATELNPFVTVEPHAVQIDETNARDLIARYDVVLDGTDNFPARYLISDSCFYEGKPLVTAAALEYDATLTTLAPHLRRPDGQPNPTYRCLFPKAPPADLAPRCALAGVLGALTGIMGAFQALEAIKVIAGIGEPLIGRLLLADTRTMRFETIPYEWSPTNPLNGSGTLTVLDQSCQPCRL